MNVQTSNFPNITFWPKIKLRTCRTSQKTDEFENIELFIPRLLKSKNYYAKVSIANFSAPNKPSYNIIEQDVFPVLLVNHGMAYHDFKQYRVSKYMKAIENQCKSLRRY